MEEAGNHGERNVSWHFKWMVRETPHPEGAISGWRPALEGPKERELQAKEQLRPRLEAWVVFLRL